MSILLFCRDDLLARRAHCEQLFVALRLRPREILTEFRFAHGSLGTLVRRGQCTDAFVEIDWIHLANQLAGHDPVSDIHQ